MGNEYDVRDWDAYGFADGEQVCSGAFTLVPLDQIARPCLSDCTFTTNRETFPDTPGLECSSNGTNGIVTRMRCYCSCDDLSRVERPSVIAMTIAYLAQSLVVVIVGINMGLRLQIFSDPP